MGGLRGGLLRRVDRLPTAAAVVVVTARRRRPPPLQPTEINGAASARAIATTGSAIDPARCQLLASRPTLHTGLVTQPADERLLLAITATPHRPSAP